MAERCSNGVGRPRIPKIHVRTLFSWQEGHLNNFVAVLISHVVDDIQSIYVSVSQPVRDFSKLALTDSNSKNFVTDWFDVNTL